MTDYRDNTALTDAQKASLGGLATAIRTKMYGKDVREAMASGLELVGTSSGMFLTPNGVVENISELNAKYPQGTSGIFVNSNDGHWYYWSGTAWADGGDYQAAKFDFSRYPLSTTNLLSGTSAIMQTLTGTGWGNFTTASNASAFESFELNTPYTYTVSLDNIPSFGVYLNANFYDGNGNNVSNVSSRLITSSGRYSIRIIVDNPAVKRIMLGVIFPASQTGNLSIDLGGEKLSYSSLAQIYSPNPNDLAPTNAIRQMINDKTYEKLLDDIYRSTSENNLLSGTSAEMQTLTGTGWGNFTTSSNALRFTNFEVGGTYTYAANIVNVPAGGMMLNVNCYDESGNLIFSPPSTQINSDGHYSLTFKVPAGTARLMLCAILPVKVTGNISIEMGGEILSRSLTDVGYHQSLENYNFDDFKKIAFKATHQVESNTLKLSTTNLLSGTSAIMQTLTGTGWGNFTTASNALRFTNFEVGETYTYAADIANVPAGGMLLNVSFYDQAGNAIAGVPGTQINADGRYSLTFKIPSGTVRLMLCAILPVKVTGNISIEMGGEILSHSLTDVGYHQSLENSVDAINNSLTYFDQKVNNCFDEFESLPTINISGNYSSLLGSNVKSILPVTFSDKNRKLKGYLKTEWQGDSSKSLPKKAFKFELYSDPSAKSELKFRPKPSFYLGNHFTLKAYYTDKYNCNDAISAEIYSRFIANNATAPKELLLANHFGTIQSMPCLLFFEGNFYGLMEMCTKAGSTLFGIDDSNSKHVQIYTNDNTDETYWNTAAPLLSNGHFASDEDQNVAQPALTNLAAKINSSVSDTDFKNNVKNIFDVNSICDYILFSYLVNSSDAWGGKNQEYLTYDGGNKWFLLAYDFDTTFGSYYQPGTVRPDDWDYFGKISNSFLDRFSNLFSDKLLSRFNELDSLGVLNVQDLQKIVDEKINNIGEGALQMEWARWPQNPVYTQSNEPDVQHIKYMLGYRKQLLKSKLNAMQGSAS